MLFIHDPTSPEGRRFETHLSTSFEKSLIQIVICTEEKFTFLLLMFYY
jgi:hypothetical protein